MNADPPRAHLVAAFAAIYIFWSGTFLAIRWAVAAIPPLVLIAARCVGGAVLIFAWLAWRGEIERTTAREWLTAAVAGAMLFVGCQASLAWAEQRVSSGDAALFMASDPLWLVLLTALWERRRPTLRVISALGIGMLAIAILTGGSLSGGALVSRLVLVGSGFAWAAGSLIARHGARPRSIVQSTAMQLLAGGIAVFLGSVMLGEPSGWSTAMLTSRSAIALAYLIVCGTVVGFGAYAWLLNVSTPAAVGSYAYVNPIGALLLGWMVGDGAPTFRTLIGAPLVVAAVVLSRPRRPASRSAHTRLKPPPATRSIDL